MAIVGQAASISRRNFIRSGLGLFTMAACTKSESPRATLRPDLVRKENVVDIRKAEGDYTVIYGNHWQVMDPKQLPEHLDGICFETATANWLKEPIQTFLSAQNTVQYSPLLKPVEEKQIPVYLVDLASDDDHSGLFGLAIYSDVFLEIAEGILGYRMIRSALKHKGKSLTRGESLKHILKICAAGYLLSPSISMALKALASFSGVAEGPTSYLLKMGLKIHPESFFFVATVRNTVLACKQEWLMKQIGSRPHFATVIGGFHIGIEDAIFESSEDRLALLKNFQSLISKTYLPESLYKITRIDFNGDNWQVTGAYEVPELKEIFGQ